ncbi:MAG: hypothetical protein QHC77_17450 [Stenotrophomonas sp.]|uniref:hypothetical protein n=1 Tax=Stenotrophomonas TaxID=40323 RepID=UPI000C32E240|nr:MULTISPECIES: hypothetical protein [unclassified Stenotrophomonas]MDX3933719.1 hypothetical protein [Stenotrophomonas sp.]PKH74082.1 hypothetical protein CXF90_05090 [Stenotrophomonas sp. Betaine-02u-23]PKH76047.1 hypothetical protein CXF96_01510 [Stenotrophomonas sp. Betaine-02u-21]PKH95956.1 hypothetical protein CXG43_10015 [Stenotrophomonas sp. Bg11-02]
MRQSVSTFRVLSIAILALGTVVATTGCFKKGARGDYALAPEVRPLEVPPDLTAPAGAGKAATTGETGSVLASQASRPAPAAAAGQAPAAPANNASGFNVTAGKDQAFTDVGTALEAIEGLTIATRAQLLGSYDVAFEGSNFLVRVVAVNGGSYVSAVDPRGLPATAEAPVKLIAALKAKLAP